MKYCYSLGEKKPKKKDFHNYFIDHFHFKSTEEFISKINRGDAFFNNSDSLKKYKIECYFDSNDITMAKIDYIEKETKINLNKYRQNLTNNK